MRAADGSFIIVQPQKPTDGIFGSRERLLGNKAVLLVQGCWTLKLPFAKLESHACCPSYTMESMDEDDIPACFVNGR